MGKFVRKERPGVAQSSATVGAKTIAGAKPKSLVVKTTAFKAKTIINVKQAKVPKITKTKAALLKPTKPAADLSDEAPQAVPIVTDTSTSSVPTLPERHITKKEKIHNRRQNLMRKVDDALEAKRTVQLKAKALKKQKKSKLSQVSKTTVHAVKAAMSDMSQMKNALLSLDDDLPSLNSLFKLKSKDLKTGVPKFDARAKRAAAAKAAAAVPGKVSKTTNTLNKKHEFMQRYNYLRKLSNDKTFKKNPREVIAAHVRNRMAEQI